MCPLYELIVKTFLAAPERTKSVWFPIMPATLCTILNPLERRYCSIATTSLRHEQKNGGIHHYRHKTLICSPFFATSSRCLSKIHPSALNKRCLWTRSTFLHLFFRKPPFASIHVPEFTRPRKFLYTLKSNEMHQGTYGENIFFIDHFNFMIWPFLCPCYLKGVHVS